MMRNIDRDLISGIRDQLEECDPYALIPDGLIPDGLIPDGLVADPLRSLDP